MVSERRVADVLRLEVPEQRDARGASVEAERMSPDDVAIDPAAATLEDLAEAVDEEVVADVVPAVSLDVVDLNPAHDRRRFLRGAGVLAGRVMDDGDDETARVAGRRADDALVRPPVLAGHDRRLRGTRGAARCGRRP